MKNPQIPADTDILVSSMGEKEYTPYAYAIKAIGDTTVQFTKLTKDTVEENDMDVLEDLSNQTLPVGEWMFGKYRKINISAGKLLIYVIQRN